MKPIKGWRPRVKAIRKIFVVWEILQKEIIGLFIDSLPSLLPVFFFLAIPNI